MHRPEQVYVLSNKIGFSVLLSETFQFDIIHKKEENSEVCRKQSNLNVVRKFMKVIQ